MEVKGIGQKIPKSDSEPKAASKFEEVFDESKKKVAEVKVTNQGVKIDLKDEESIMDTLTSPYINNSQLFNSLKEWMAAFRKELQEKEVTSEEERAGPSTDYHLRQTLYLIQRHISSLKLKE